MKSKNSPFYITIATTNKQHSLSTAPILITSNCLLTFSQFNEWWSYTMRMHIPISGTQFTLPLTPIYLYIHVMDFDVLSRIYSYPWYDIISGTQYRSMNIVLGYPVLLAHKVLILSTKCSLWSMSSASMETNNNSNLCGF